VTSRKKRYGLAVAAFVGAMVASGCSFHPGQAAVVNGSNISESTVSDLVTAGCSYFEANRKESPTGGAEPATSIAYLRHVFTLNLISFKIVDKAASELHLTVSPAVLAKATSGQRLPAGLQGEDRERLKAFFDASTRAEVQKALIGAHLKDPSVTTADHVTRDQTQDSVKYLRAFTLRQHVTVNPAYGTWSHGQLLDTDGSLSAAQSSTARRWLSIRAANLDSSGENVDQLPASQVCG
jgi:hypothetical protein